MREVGVVGWVSIQGCYTVVTEANDIWKLPLNPRANTIVEIIHLSMGDILRTDHFVGLHWKEEITILLQTIYWDLGGAVHTMDGYSSGTFSLAWALSYRLRQ